MSKRPGLSREGLLLGKTVARDIYSGQIPYSYRVFRLNAGSAARRSLLSIKNCEVLTEFQTIEAGNKNNEIVQFFHGCMSSFSNVC